MNFFRHFLGVMKYMQQPRNLRRLTFYSEGKNYWPYLQPLVEELVRRSQPLSYISSDKYDDGLSFKHEKFFPFLIDEKYLRNWLFENIDCDVLVLTMPDLHNFQVKKSRKNVHYVYVHHSLVSHHMIYNEGAFDHFNTIFCSGPHHVHEMRAIEAARNLDRKNLVEHGYARLDQIIDDKEKKYEDQTKETTIIIAPSWGPNGLIEAGHAQKYVRELLSESFHVHLRPHPQTLKFAPQKIEEILQEHKENKNFSLENSISQFNSLFNSDLMISDWSGVAYEFALGLKRPVLFIDHAKKVNNSNYKNLRIEPFEISSREKFGRIMKPSDNLIENVEQLLNGPNETYFKASDLVFNVGRSAKAGADALIRQLKGESNDARVEASL